MIKIEFEAATGADLRKEMLDLLGLGQLTTTVSGKDLSFILDLKKEGKPDEYVNQKEFDAIAEIKAESTKTEETPKPEQPTRKRRSRADIEAEAALAANTGSEEPPASTDNVEIPTEGGFNELMDKIDSEKTETAVTAEDLTKKCVELGRNGKRDAVLAVFESQFGGATISKKDGKPQLTAEQYPAVMEALNALA